MSNPAVDDYWRRVAEGWSDAVADANAGHADKSVTARQLRVPFLSAEGPLVVTGTRGAGKSVIYKALVGLNGAKYTKTQESKRVERRRVKFAKNGSKVKAKIYVLPGQRDYRPRLDGIDRLFKHGNYPVGVIHVVNWGFAEVWDRGGRQLTIKKLIKRRKPISLTGVSEYLRDTEELEDFYRTSSLLKEAWTGRGDEVWFIIAVAKCDLYWKDIEHVQRYYIPGNDPKHDSAFAKELRSLIEQLQFPKFAVLPVSSVSDPFNFNSTIQAVTGKFDDGWRAALVGRLLTTIGDFNGA